ncbi:MAG: hypothetical protein JKY37_02510 [Nannocystaceae bacterium]|nr:hypothetical protein [Nannocystaceae bacterium]
MRRFLVLVGCVAMAASTGNSGQEKKPAKQPPAAKYEKADARTVKGDPAPKAPAQPNPDGPSDSPSDGSAEATPDPETPNDDRSGRYMDPTWFRKTIFADAVKVDFTRSQLDDAGLFSSQFLFDLKEGVDAASCAKTLEEKIGTKVTGLEREEKDGRITFKGGTDRYRLVMMCGEAKGMMKAYVSYTWTS